MPTRKSAKSDAAHSLKDAYEVVRLLRPTMTIPITSSDEGSDAVDRAVHSDVKLPSLRALRRKASSDGYPVADLGSPGESDASLLGNSEQLVTLQAPLGSADDFERRPARRTFVVSKGKIIGEQG